MVAQSQTISTGIYVIRRRQLIDLIEHCAEEERHDFVTDILIRYKNLKKIYGYKDKQLLEQHLNRGFILPDKYGFPEAGGEKVFLSRMLRGVFQGERSSACQIQSGAVVKNSLIGSGSIINGTVENSIIFKKVFVGQQLCDQKFNHLK